MNPRVSHRALVLILASTMALAAVGLMPDSAKAVTTSWLYKQVRSLKSQVASISSVNSAQASAITWIKGQLTSVRSADAAQSATIGAIQSVDASQSADIQALQTAVAGLEARLDNADTTITALTSRVGTLETEVAGLRGQVAALQSEDASLAARLYEAESQIYTKQSVPDFFWPNTASFEMGTTLSQISSDPDFVIAEVPLLAYLQGQPVPGQRAFAVAHFPGGDVMGTSEGSGIRFAVPASIYAGRDSTVSIDYWVEWGGFTEYGEAIVSTP